MVRSILVLFGRLRNLERRCTFRFEDTEFQFPKSGSSQESVHDEAEDKFNLKQWVSFVLYNVLCKVLNQFKKLNSS